jgi:hypothetical protein
MIKLKIGRVMDEQKLCEKVICEIIAERGKVTVRELFEELDERGLLDGEPDYSMFHPDTVLEPGPNWHLTRIN